MDQPSKLSEYAFALEQDQKAQEVKTFLRQVLGGYEYERNTTVAFIEGYHAAMKRIIQQAEL